ncbi:alpha/beta hydrolase [Kibdelosporangium philippinense]|uniref:Alpha/beta hydrolase n=1 Tax=Kibdelosporangium philippinense TaxID=211113 RepID=A0ABS8ZBL8_9PSEU|nr:alpha/beta hydrolase [Kibdelosporangium philippinense]MCE7005271.1 alpha/beta hydrolase [Kibdelosporangium philippinense]
MDIPVTASEQSVRLERFFATRVRPVADRWVARGVQLRAIRRFADSGGLQRLPRGSKVWTANYGHVRGTWVQATGASVTNGIQLHFHGGGFVFGSPRSHRSLALVMSRRTGRPVFLPNYRRAPEHPYPAAADDCLTVYRRLLDRGIPAGKIVVSGDSAGGHLTACLLADVKRHGLPMPSHAVFFSPWLDLSGELAAARDLVHRDPFVAPRAIQNCRRAYLGDRDPRAERPSVLTADKSGWPPSLIQVGDTECLLDDARRLADSLRAAEIPVELQEWPGQVHVFQAFSNYVPEGRQAIRYVAEFLADVPSVG